MVHGSRGGRTACWSPPFVLAVLTVGIGNSKSLLIVGMETIVRVLFLNFINIVILVVIIDRIILIVQVIFVLFLKCLLIDLLAKLTNDVLLLKSVGDG